MSTVTYKNGAKEYSIECSLQLDCISPIAVEENLHELIRLDIQKNSRLHYGVHDITLVDDKGKIAFAKDLSKIGNLIIVKQ